MIDDLVKKAQVHPSTPPPTLEEIMRYQGKANNVTQAPQPASEKAPKIISVSN
jgi:hypothetical protein